MTDRELARAVKVHYTTMSRARSRGFKGKTPADWYDWKAKLPGLSPDPPAAPPVAPAWDDVPDGPLKDACVAQQFGVDVFVAAQSDPAMGLKIQQSHRESLRNQLSAGDLVRWQKVKMLGDDVRLNELQALPSEIARDLAEAYDVDYDEALALIWGHIDEALGKVMSRVAAYDW